MVVERKRTLLDRYVDEPFDLSCVSSAHFFRCPETTTLDPQVSKNASSPIYLLIVPTRHGQTIPLSTPKSVLAPVHRGVTCLTEVMSTPLSPDTPRRPLPSFPTQEAAENTNEILQALDTYKRKDPAKGSFAQASQPIPSPSRQ